MSITRVVQRLMILINDPDGREDPTKYNTNILRRLDTDSPKTGDERLDVRSLSK